MRVHVFFWWRQARPSLSTTIPSIKHPSWIPSLYNPFLALPETYLNLTLSLLTSECRLNLEGGRGTNKYLKLLERSYRRHSSGLLFRSGSFRRRRLRRQRRSSLCSFIVPTLRLAAAGLVPPHRLRLTTLYWFRLNLRCELCLSNLF